MRNLAQELVQVYSRLLAERQIAQAQRRDFFKWLRFYLDFCDKYRHPPRERGSRQLFMMRLHEDECPFVPRTVS